MDSQNISNNVQVQNETLRVNKIPGIISLIKEAWSILIDKKEIILGLSAVNVFLGVFYNYFVSMNKTNFIILGTLISFAVTILTYIAFVLIAKDKNLSFEQIISKAVSMFPRILSVEIIYLCVFAIGFIPVIFVLTIVSGIVFFALGINIEQIEQFASSNFTLPLSTIVSSLDNNLLSFIIIGVFLILIALIAILIFQTLFVFSNIISIENGKIWKAIENSVQLVRQNLWSVVWRMAVINLFSFVIIHTWSYSSTYIFEILNMQNYSALYFFVTSIPMLVIMPMIVLYTYRMYCYINKV